MSLLFFGLSFIFPLAFCADSFSDGEGSEGVCRYEGCADLLTHSGADLYTSSDHLPSTLLSPTKGPSYQVEDTAFQNAVGTTKPRWEWLEEKVPREQLGCQGAGYPGLPARDKTSGDEGKGNHLVSRPELELFGLAMLGGGLVFGAAHPYGELDSAEFSIRQGVLTGIDYPWEDLGEATLVDVGGGVGKSHSEFSVCESLILTDQIERC